MMLAGVDTVQSVGLEMLPSFQVPIPAASSDSRVCSGQDHDCLPCQPVHAHDAKDSLPLLLPAVVSAYCMEIFTWQNFHSFTDLRTSLVPRTLPIFLLLTVWIIGGGLG